jgi:hypothetical protein
VRVTGVSVTNQETADAGEGSLLQSNGNQPSFASALLAIGAQPTDHQDGASLGRFGQGESREGEPASRSVRIHKAVPRTTAATEPSAVIGQYRVQWASQLAVGAKWSGQLALGPAPTSTGQTQEVPSSVQLPDVKREGPPDDAAGPDATTTAKSEPLFTSLPVAPVKSSEIAGPASSSPGLGVDRNLHHNEQGSSITAERPVSKMSRMPQGSAKPPQAGMQGVDSNPSDGQSEDLSEINVTAADLVNSHMTRVLEERVLPDSRSSDTVIAPNDSLSTESDPVITAHAGAEPAETWTVENAVSAAASPSVVLAVVQSKRSEGQSFRFSSGELLRRPTSSTAPESSSGSFAETFSDLAKVKRDAASSVDDKSATSLSDKGSPLQRTTTDSARAIEDAMRGELRVRVQTETFGRVTIQTNAGGGQLAAQLSIENAKQSTALASHLPAVEQRIGEKYGLEASVLLARNGDGGTSMGSSSAGSRGSDSHRRQDSSRVTASRGVLNVEKDEGAGVDLAILAPRNPASTSRLDVTA